MSQRTLFNAEVFFCFLLVLVVVARLSRITATVVEPSKTRMHHALLLITVLFVTVAAYWPSLHDPLLSDDYILIQSSAAPEHLLSVVQNPSGDGTMRPVGDFLFGTYKYWAGIDAVRWHMLSLLLHILNIAALYWLTFRLSGLSLVSFLAALFFALHAAHPEAVAWTAAIFDLLATFLSLLTLLTLTCKSTYILFLSSVLMALAILAKESAYTLPGIAILLFYSWKKVTRTSLVALGSCTAVCAALFINRWIVFHGPGGYIDLATGKAQILNTTLFSAGKALLYRPWAVLMIPINFSESLEIQNKIILVALGVALVYLVFRSATSRQQNLSIIGCIVVSLLPPLHVALITADLLGTRVFYLPTVFFSIWFAALVASLPKSLSVIILSTVLATFHFFALRHNLLIRSRISLIGARACNDAALSIGPNDEHLWIQVLPRTLDGVFSLQTVLTVACNCKTRAEKYISTSQPNQKPLKIGEFFYGMKAHVD